MTRTGLLRSVCASALLPIVAFGQGQKAQKATFSVDGVASAPSTVIATVQPRAGAAGYSWLRVSFYTAPPPAAGSTNWAAVLQLTLDRSSTVWQIDLSLPGHTCTVAETDRDAKSVLQTFQFDGRQLRLRSKGTHVCDMTSLKIPNQRFEWDVDVDVPLAGR